MSLTIFIQSTRILRPKQSQPFCLGLHGLDFPLRDIDTGMMLASRKQYTVFSCANRLQVFIFFYRIIIIDHQQ